MIKMRMILVVTLALVLVAASCGADSDDGGEDAVDDATDETTVEESAETGDSGESTEDTGGDDETEPTPGSVVELPTAGEDSSASEDLIVPGYLVVDEDRANLLGLTVDDVLFVLEDELDVSATQLEVGQYLEILSEENEGLLDDSETGDLYLPIQATVEERVEILAAPNIDFADMVQTAARNDGDLWRLLENNAIAPIHVMTASGHWSALPGTKPERVDSKPWTEAQGSDSVGPVSDEQLVIGVVDTGSLDTSTYDSAPWMSDTTSGQCEDISHGQAVISSIEQVNPSAEVLPTNAFLPMFPCMHTQEAFVFRAIQRVVDYAGADLDVLNFSLGTPGYHTVADRGGQEIVVFLEPILLRETLTVAVEAVGDLTFTAAAGNHYAVDQLDELADEQEQQQAIRINYPAAFALDPQDEKAEVLAAAVTAVFAAGPGQSSSDATKAVIQWNDQGDPHAFAVGFAVAAPGCALILDGVDNTKGGTSEVIVWSGSSFASPIVAATGDSNLGYSSLPGGLWNDSIYPASPTGCESPTP